MFSLTYLQDSKLFRFCQVRNEDFDDDENNDFDDSLSD